MLLVYGKLMLKNTSNLKSRKDLIVLMIIKNKWKMLSEIEHILSQNKYQESEPKNWSQMFSWVLNKFG